MNDVVYSQLLAAKAAIESAILMVKRIEEEGPCRHPKDKRKSLATLGEAGSWLCQVCDHIEEGLENA